MMNFFRRPQLAGNNLYRPAMPYVRGSVRRSDPDGTSGVPYFPLVSASQTLDLKVDGVVFNVILSGNAIATVLSDINTVLGVAGYASDADGSIQIRTNTIGSLASVEVTGGTAAAGLGFDLGTGSIRVVSSDVDSSPEGRLGNWFGTSFPNRGENLTSEIVNRSFSRLSSNLDVLFSEHMRMDALPKKTAYTTSDGKNLVPTTPDSVLVFTGLGLLSASSTKEDLAPFFFLIDQATGLPPASRVVGVVRGTPPSGLPPYANATTWSGGGSTGNVLGQDLIKVSTSITKIKEGRVLYCSGADFVTAKVVPGDFVSISGATNLTPYSNNGYRWVVEKVINLTSIAVRPMSMSELQIVGTSPTDEQPIVELNGNITIPETYGTVSVRTGTYANDVQIIVDPPIPSGATYDLYLSVPGDIRSRKPHESQAKDAANRYAASDLKPSPNVLLTPPTVSSWSAAQVVLTSGYARFSDRVVSIPSKTIPAATFDNTALPNYVYWDKDTNDVKVTKSHVKVVNSDPTQSPGSGFPSDTQASQHLIAEVYKTGANITAVKYEGRAAGEIAASRVITVGVDGQFTKLEDAARFVNRWAKGNAHRADTYPQFEIVITSNTTVDFSTISFGDGVYQYPATPQIFFDCPVKIRGARPDVQLKLKNYVSATPFEFGYTYGGTYTLEDLFISCDGTFAGIGLFYGRAGTNCVFKNITSSGAIKRFGFFDGFGVTLDSCIIADLKEGVLSATNNAEVHVLGCTFYASFTGTAPVVFDSTAFSVFPAKRLTVRDCVFNNLSTDQGYTGVPLMGNFGHRAVFDNCTFSGAVGLAGVDSLLFKQQYIDGPLHINNCTSSTPARCFINTGTHENHCTVDGCNIYVAPDAGNPGIRCGSLTNCTVYGQGGTSPTLVEAMRECSGNFLAGSSSVAIKNSSSSGSTFFTNITNNRIEVSGGVSILAYSNNPITGGVEVSGNQILLTGTAAVGIQTYNGFDSLNQGTISGNSIRIRTGDGTSNKVGIYARGSCLLSGNRVFNAFGESTFTAGHIGIKLDTASGTRLIGNSVVFSAGNYACVSVEGSQHSAILCGNYLENSGTGSALSFTGATSTNTVVSGNRITGSTTAVSGLTADTFSNNIVSGTVTSPSPNGVSKKIHGNTFFGTTTINGQTQRGTTVSNNVFSSTLTLGGTYVDFTENVVADAFNGYTNINAFQNVFTGSSGINFQFASFVIEQNVFTGTTATITIEGPASIVGNRFPGNNLMTLNVGDSSLTGSGYIIVFNDNYCTCTTNLYSDSSTTMFVEGNYLGGVNTITDVDKFNDNWLFLGGTGVNIFGRRVNDGLGRAPASGNVLYGGGVSTFTGMDFSGCTVRASAGTIGFTDCSFSGSDINTGGTTATLNGVYVSSSSIKTTSGLTVTGGRTGGLTVAGCRFPEAISISYSSTTYTQVDISGCTFGGNVFVNGHASANGSSFLLSDSVLLHNTGVGPSFADLIMSPTCPAFTTITGCWIGGTVTAYASSIFHVSDSTFAGFGPHTLSAGGHLLVDQVVAVGPLHSTGAAEEQIIRGCWASAIKITPELSRPRILISGNIFYGAFPGAGIEIVQGTAFGNNTDESWSIVGNDIYVSNAGTVTQSSIVHAISLSSTTSKGPANVLISGNKISIETYFPDPTGLPNGTYDMAAIYLGNGRIFRCSIIGNTIIKPQSNSYSFPAGGPFTRIINVFYVKMVNATQVFLSGNIMWDGLASWGTAGSGRQGETVLFAGAGTYSLQN